jgi:hypothetical protein
MLSKSIITDKLNLYTWTTTNLISSAIDNDCHIVSFFHIKLKCTFRFTMIVRPVIKVIMVLELINTLNANLNLTFVMKSYLVGSMDILKNTSILQEQLVFEKGKGNDSNSVILFNDSVVQTSNIIKTDTQDTIKRKKRFTHFSDMSHKSDITDKSKRCLCPWKTKWNYDSRRTPVFIAKAICSNKCNFNFTSTQLSYLSDVLTSCEPFTRGI